VPRSPNQSMDSIRPGGDPAGSAPRAGWGGDPMYGRAPASAAEGGTPREPPTSYQQTMPAQVQTAQPGQWASEPMARSALAPSGPPMARTAAVPAGAGLSGLAMVPSGGTMHATEPGGTTLDQSGNPNSAIMGDGTEVFYNSEGVPTSGVTTDGSQLTYDSSGQVVSEVKQDGTTISFENGNPASAIMPDGTKVLYNSDGLPTSGITTDGSKLVYDGSGQVASQVTQDGTTISYDNGNPTSAVSPDGTTTTFYPDGDPKSVAKDGVTTNYNNDGYVTSVTGPEGTQNYSYGKDGTIAIQDGNTTTTYDKNGHRLTTNTIGSDGKPLIIDWSVDLPALLTAASAVRSYHGNLIDQQNRLKNTFNEIAQDWRAPSGESFQTLIAGFAKVVAAILEQLEEAATRMQKSYDNYMSTENINTKSLIPVQ
jgi:YD repeat-containing protein